MKICVTSQGNEPGSLVDGRFGRAENFLIVESESLEFEAIVNCGPQSSGGAGVNAAKQVIDSGAEAVLTGNVGPNAMRVLTAGGVKVYTGVTGTVKEAVEKFNSGKLQASEQASVDFHFGSGS